MKKLILLPIMALFLPSCTAVKFEDPQPFAAPSLAEFPDKMCGTYVSNNEDTLFIEPGSFRYARGIETGITGDLNTPKTVLKKVNRTYILNLHDQDTWSVFPLKASKNKIVTHCANITSESEQLIFDVHKSSPVKEITTEDGKFAYFLLAPTNKEFRQLLRKKLFSEKMVFKRLE
ncbi:hypothetical protein JRG66_02175 [Salinimicrobium tongyeongense]|jgi:hypothetical protein|uniref:Lipoprotein n=1 Tax=Salinimicrobium tongyeongense TaxID=2809707 RepID=A0ABY6NS27_9FLAO|nr:hypothetical protein [Salinimicrobium tongyeongense]UZH55714.1 hypothetical protein JRG66_02175 [Salinimicrobium tongyeongense]